MLQDCFSNNDTLLPGQTKTYTFTATTDLSTVGATYLFDGWPSLTGDTAAEKLGNVESIHVVLTYEGTTYEYRYGTDYGYSFRAYPASVVCKVAVECKKHPVAKDNQQ